MTAATGRKRTRREALAEIDRLSQAQLQAARAGNLAELGRLLGARRTLLAERTAGTGPAAPLQELITCDAQTTALVRAELQRVEDALAQLHQGRRLLHGYAVRVAAPPGFIDQRR